MNDISNSTPAQLDLTEGSLEEIMRQITASFAGPIAIKPKRAIVPPWIVEQIEAQYGAPATEEKYHKWNMARLGMSLDEYSRALAIESARG
jgi:hypothetical protein